jgi:Zn-dependent protease
MRPQTQTQLTHDLPNKKLQLLTPPIWYVNVASVIGGGLIAYETFIQWLDLPDALLVLVGIGLGTGALTFAVLVHELAHAAMMIRHGGSAKVFVSPAFGYCEASHPDLVDLPSVLLAGPLSNLVLAGISYSMVRIFPNQLPLYLGFFLLWFAVLNLALGVTNLLPIHPLDGGRLLTTLCERIRNRTARRVVLLLAALSGAAFSAFLLKLSVAHISPAALISAAFLLGLLAISLIRAGHLLYLLLTDRRPLSSSTTATPQNEQVGRTSSMQR